MALESTITAVTVFTDRAQVTRTATVKLRAGEQTVTFDSLPDAIEENSVQVGGAENATLRGIAFRREHYARVPDEKRRELLDERRRLQDLLEDADGRIAQAAREREFVYAIGNRITGLTEKAPQPELDPAKWSAMADFYRSRIDKLDREAREIERSKRSVSDELHRVKARLDDLGSRSGKQRNVVDVVIDAPQEGETKLTLTYIVYGPSWTPVYDLRVSTDERRMSVAYNATVCQSTGEDWCDVRLMLSTAQVQVSGVEPELAPWRINFRPVVRNVPPPAMMARAAPAKSMRAVEEEADEMLGAMVAEPPAPMAVEEAAVETGATAVVFAVPGTQAIPSDNTPHRVSVMVRDFDAHFRYSTVPKLAPYVFLKARIANDTDFPFLPGESNVFLDNSFVANASLELVAPGQELWTFLGIDEGMKVEHKLVRRYEKREGVVSKKTRVIYEYLIEITNNKKHEHEIAIQDQLPISGHQDITVEPLEPRLGKPDSPRKDEHDKLTWERTLQAGEKASIPFSFFVEFPRGRTLEGLV
ncbi:MAG: mucoidy inhibitor MuiA family protein [Chitinivibrionales bacterium]|nr:mucoidy inhibitor MuiA family protein [Chitinivibrionales bacterium]